MGRQQGELPLPQNKKKSSDDIFIKLAEMKQVSKSKLAKEKYNKHLQRV